MQRFFTLLLVLTSFAIKGQDTLTVMAYNILNYPTSNATKADTLKPIIEYIKPDIFLITELRNSSGVTTILTDALNVNGTTSYQSATYQNGPDSDNMVFYNSDKIKLKSQYEIATSLRNISEYVLYYDNGTLTPTSDTVFIHTYMAHLKASNTPADSAQRYDEAVSFKNYLDSKPQPIENIVFGGDFNVYTSTEGAYNMFLSGGTVPLNDPINTPGEWHNNFSFSAIHTQSTRTSFLGDGGSTGGMDDRFDFILVGDDVMSGTNQLKYVANSYTAVGNDGNHFNSSLIAAPTNSVVPANIAEALYYMSDHLPIVLKLYYNSVTGIDDAGHEPKWNGYYYNQQFQFTSAKSENKLTVKIYDLVGKIVQNHFFANQKAFNIHLSNLKSGLYFVKVNNQSTQKTYRIIKQ